jgi:hypothetical protein
MLHPMPFRLLFHQALRLLEIKDPVGIVDGQWPEFELMSLGKLLRQEVLQIAGKCKVRYKSKSHAICCQVFFILVLCV